MNATLTRRDLVTVLTGAAAILPAKAAVPIQSCLLLSVAPDAVTVTAQSGGSVALVRTSCAANGATPGEVAVNAAQALSYAKALPEGIVTLTSDGAKLTLTGGRSKLSVPCLPAADLPPPPDADVRASMTMPAATWAALSSMAYAAGEADNKYGLAGAPLSVRGGVLRFAATDGNRLAVTEAEVPGAIGTGARQVPADALDTLRKMLPSDGDITIEIGDRALMARAGSTTAVIRLLEAAFPNFDAVVPTVHKATVTVDREALAVAVRRVALAARDSVRTVRVTFGDEIALSAKSELAGEAVDSVPCERDGHAVVMMGFNSAFLAEALGQFSSTTVTIGISDALSPAVIRPVGGADRKSTRLNSSH